MLRGITDLTQVELNPQDQTGFGPRSGRVWSLWDVMNVFLAHDLMASVKNLVYWSDLADYMRAQNRGHERFNEASYKLMLEALTKLSAVCAQCAAQDPQSRFRDVAQQAALIHQRLSFDPSSVDYIAGELANAWDAVLKASFDTRFLRVAVARSVCVDNPNLMGPKVIDAFPKAKADIIEAGNCLAAECNTAAVFHLMRVFEWGIRQFLADLGAGKRLVNHLKKENRFEYMPTSFATWERMIGAIPGRVERKLKKLRRGTRKQALQAYYGSVYDDIKNTKDAWRNHVMHTREDFDGPQANTIFGRVKDMMERMAAKP